MNVTFGVIKLSEEGRDKLSLLFTIISLILTFFSAILIINSMYLTLAVAPNLHSEKAVIRLIFSVIAMLSSQLVIYYVAGIFVCKKCHNDAYKKNSRYLLRIWTFSGYSSIANIVIIGTMAAGVSNHIVRSMHHSMVRGMKRYLKDISWKRIIDSLQNTLQCCGSKKYTDWHEISWISTWHLISTNSDIHGKYKINGDRLYIPAVPWSCCRLDYPKQCFHDPIQQYQYTQNWNTLQEESVYNVGCVEILRQPVENSFLCFILISYLILILQLILTVISRYLYTSYKNAVILGDPFGISPGWLLGGKAASEIMAENRMSMSTTSGGKTTSLTSKSSKSSKTRSGSIPSEKSTKSTKSNKSTKSKKSSKSTRCTACEDDD